VATHVNGVHDVVGEVGVAVLAAVQHLWVWVLCATEQGRGTGLAVTNAS
jgi:hypothetical protein